MVSASRDSHLRVTAAGFLGAAEARQRDGPHSAAALGGRQLVDRAVEVLAERAEAVPAKARQFVYHLRTVFRVTVREAFG